MRSAVMLVTFLFATPIAAASGPSTPPPKVAGAAVAPPPAWIESAAAPSRWLAYSSFCWRTTCVDFLPPAMRPDLPRIRAARGTLVTFHLGFKPSQVRVEVVGTARTWTLLASRASRWRVVRAGTVVLTAKGPSGSASYAIRIV